MKIVYLSTEKVAGTVNFENSLKRFGYDNHPQHEIVVLGKDEQFKGWRYRMQKYRDYLASIDPLEIVMFTDADDVLFCRSPNQIEDIFKKCNKPILVGSETNVYAHAVQTYVLSNYGRRHPEFRGYGVNGGSVIGYADALLKLYQWGLDSNHTDDQRMLGDYTDHHIDLVALDIHCSIFCVFQPISHGDRNDVTWSIDENGFKRLTLVRGAGDQEYTCQPYVLHFAFEFFSPTWKSLLSGKVVQHQVYKQIAREIVGDDQVKHHFSSLAMGAMSATFWSVIIAFVVLGILWIILLTFVIVRARRKTKLNGNRKDKR